MASENKKYSRMPRLIRRELLRLFSLRADKADDQSIDQALRAGIEMRGTNLWVLMFAIFIASIGLNVNSAAVIIGAMLISPLMGPIMGIGYGVGVHDFSLVKSALKNLGIAVFISLCTSIVYFLLSPLTQAQSELLARTTPTIWDVLIALFGGLAGIVGVTRKEKSTVIPGVAIATALMPPLCTAGYGIAIGNWRYFGGAFYLFTINSVFIALSSALVVRALKIHQKEFVNPQVARRVKNIAMTIAVLTVAPSIYLAYGLVQQEVFKSNANYFIGNELSLGNTFVTSSRILPESKTIEVTLLGDRVSPEQIATMRARMPSVGLSGVKLIIHQQSDQQKIDIRSLRSSVLSDLYSKSQSELEQKNRQIAALQQTLAANANSHAALKNVSQELHALFPQISAVMIADAFNWTPAAEGSIPSVLLVNIMVKHPINAADREKISTWLRTRMQVEQVKLVVERAENGTRSR